MIGPHITTALKAGACIPSLYTPDFLTHQHDYLTVHSSTRPLLILYLVMVSFAFVPLTEFRLPEDQHCLSVLSICISVLGDHPRDDAGLSQALTLLHVENVKARTPESHHAAVFHPLICRGVLRANYTLLQSVACHRIRQRLLFHSAARPVLPWSCTCISWPCL